MTLKSSKKDKGEDALFISQKDFGVFDGVGGWRSSGVDSGEYSRHLAAAVADNLRTQREEKSATDIKVSTALDYGALSCAKSRLTGSSTACIASLNDTLGVLTVLNLGDSGIIVCRKTENGIRIIFKAVMTTHSFNFPFQIGNIGDPKYGKMLSDTSSDAIIENVQLKDGDISVMGTDGLWDNLFDEDIVSILSRSKIFEKAASDRVESDLQPLLSEISTLTLKKASNTKERTPWSVGVEKHYKERYTGGKPDDVSIILSSFSNKR